MAAVLPTTNGVRWHGGSAKVGSAAERRQPAAPAKGRQPAAGLSRLRLAQHGQREVRHSVAQRQQAANQPLPVAVGAATLLRQTLPRHMGHRVATEAGQRMQERGLGVRGILKCCTDYHRAPKDVRHAGKLAACKAARNGGRVDTSGRSRGRVGLTGRGTPSRTGLGRSGRRITSPLTRYKGRGSTSDSSARAQPAPQQTTRMHGTVPHGYAPTSPPKPQVVSLAAMASYSCRAPSHPPNPTLLTAAPAERPAPSRPCTPPACRPAPAVHAAPAGRRHC